MDIQLTLTPQAETHMKHVLSLILLLLPLYSYADIQTKEIQLTHFSQLILNSAIDTQIIQGDEEKLIIRGDSQFIEQVDARIKNDQLSISLSNRANNADNLFSNSARMQIKLHVKTLSQVSNLGSADLFFKDFKSDAFTLNLNGSGDAAFGTIQANRFDLLIAGSGDCKIVKLLSDTITLSSQGSGDIALGELQAQSVTASLAGSGDLSIKLDSETKSQKISMMGSGDYFAKKLNSQTLSIATMGSGDAEVYVEANLDAEVFGSGDVVYHGNPVINQTSSGSGRLYQHNNPVH